jgi:sodium/potassium/calcium exchanger 6
MRKTLTKAVPDRIPNPQRKFRFRAFYITVLCLSLFAVVSLVADQSARYHHGAQYGEAQRRALEELDTTRLVKRDEEVRKIPHSVSCCSVPF